MPNTIVGYLNGGTVVVIDSAVAIKSTPRTVGDGLQQSLTSGPANNAGYNGMAWFKGAWMIGAVDYWPSEQATPWAGQLYPLAGASGGPGQVMPY